MTHLEVYINNETLTIFFFFFSRNHVSPDAALWFFLEASSIDGYCKEVFLGCSQLNFSRIRSMTSKLWDVLSIVTKSIRLGMSFSEHLWKDAAVSILRVAASNSTNDSLDSIKIPNVGKPRCFPFSFNDWTI